MPRDEYPKPGTNADEILKLIQSTPGISVSGIVKTLKMNPSPVRACLKALENHGNIQDHLDESGHHHYTTRILL